jgi:streptomycin 6-kinase
MNITLKLDQIVSNAIKEFHLENLEPILLSDKKALYNCYLGANPVVLKCSVNSSEIDYEKHALDEMKWLSCAKLIESGESFLILERIFPATKLSKILPKGEEIATDIFIKTLSHILTLHSDKKGFDTIDSWVHLIISQKDWHPEISTQISKAIEKINILLVNKKNQVLLHGDLHHDNIVQNGLDWVFIDPKGVVGEIEYEVGCFLRNPINQLSNNPDAQKVIENRINKISSKLNLDRERIKDWAFIQSVLAYIWAKEDGINQGDFLRLINIFDSLA